MIATFSEIIALESFIKRNKVSVTLYDDGPNDCDFIKSLVKIGDMTFNVMIEDEQDDLMLNDSRVNVVLVLRELELIHHSSDYLHWCRLQGLLCHADRGKLHAYYQNIVWMLPKLYQLFGKNEIETFISDLDFELNSGAMQFLREPS